MAQQPTRSPLPKGDAIALDSRLTLVETTLRAAWLVGKTNEELRKMFKKETGIEVSECTLRRYFKKLGYKKRGAGTSPEDRLRIERAVAEMCPARGMGHRSVRDELAIRFGPEFRVPRKLVADILRASDPDSNRFRWHNRLIRRKYVSSGPGSTLHVDQKCAFDFQ
jgi:hypothetical protein